MPERIVVIIPTKARAAGFRRFANSWMKTTEGLSHVVVGLDEGDTDYDRLKERYPFTWEHVSPKPFLHILNELALKYADQYDYVAFMEDDCVYLSTNWESTFIRGLESLGENGIVWGNDGLNEDRLVGLPVMSTSIVRRLGFMAPSELKCLYADNYWIDLGQATGTMRYYPDVLIRHDHYSTTFIYRLWRKLKRFHRLPMPRDAISAVVDLTGNEDADVYERYLATALHAALDLARAVSCAYLVLGSEGQIGRPLMALLRAEGHEVHGIDLVCGSDEDLRHVSPRADELFGQADFLFFLAFDVGGSRYFKVYERTFGFLDNNMRIMDQVFDRLHRHGTPFVFASSQMSGMNWSPYGCLKGVGEKYTEVLDGRVVTLWNVYGVEHDREKFHVVTDFIHAARTGHDIRMLTTGEEVRQFLHVSDCCRAIYAVSRNYDAVRGEPLHATSFEWVPIRRIADIIAGHFGVGVVPGPHVDDVQHDSRLEPSDAIKRIWQPRVGLEEGILRVIQEIG